MSWYRKISGLDQLGPAPRHGYRRHYVVRAGRPIDEVRREAGRKGSLASASKRSRAKITLAKINFPPERPE